MNAMDIRKKFIEFFSNHQHSVIPGSSLVPENDPSVLFTTAGMHPLVPYLLGEPHPLGKRLVNYQKCLRTDDIDEVGDDIHLTFFEMLGNWSLGDYFKEDSIQMSYDFLVNWLRLDPGRLAVTIFEGDEDSPKDEEASKIWRSLGIREENIYFLGRKHNWWGPAGQTGPCGPDTEIFYDSLKPKCSEDCNPGCDCGKYWEIWNNVFMKYYRNADGTFTELQQRNVDTGLGLERMTAIMEEKESIFETELLSGIVKQVKTLAKKQDETSIRIVADHIRASCFILIDRVIPGNVDQGYILRRLIRRAIRHMRKLEINPDRISELGYVTIESLRELYSELDGQQSYIINSLVEEKNKFTQTLEKGEKQFHKALEMCQKDGKSTLDAKTVFTLYDTFGFPPEITAELASESGLAIDYAGFEELYRLHQELSRQGAQQKFRGGLVDNAEETIALHTATHLLHKALKIVLGEHVHQKGSNITKERLRFDFSHGQKMTPEEIQKVEDIVNAVIEQGLQVECNEMLLEEAEKIGAEGLFTEKYGEIVKVYMIGNFSKEICGGPHVSSTADLGHFKIVKEESVASGVRRIKDVTTERE